MEQKLENVFIIKKDGTKEAFNAQKIVNAITKSAQRVLVKFNDDDYQKIIGSVIGKIQEMDMKEINISTMHYLVENALEESFPQVAKSYRDYRNYKQDFVKMLDDVYVKSQAIMYIGDKENSNTDSALVSTKRSLIFNQFENVWECPCHASKFDIDGNCLKGPSKKNISYKE